jgi:hypothetical protein
MLKFTANSRHAVHCDGALYRLRPVLLCEQHFAIRVGARRLADAAVCLAFIGEHQGAGIADEQARLAGALQHPLVAGDRITVARLLRRLPAGRLTTTCRPPLS